MRRREVVALTLLASLAAQAPLAARAQTQGQALPPPAQPIAAFNQGLLQIMRAGKSTPFAPRAQQLQPLVQQVFDLTLILQNSVGLRWPSYAAQQKDDLLEAFTRWTVATWVANFNSYDGETFQISPELRRIGSDVVVRSEIVPREGKPTRLDYVMRNVGGAWKAIDILVDGISRVATQRSDFRSSLSSGDPAPLIANLRYKADALAAGMKT